MKRTKILKLECIAVFFWTEQFSILIVFLLCSVFIVLPVEVTNYLTVFE